MNTYVVVGQNRWATGDSLTAAKARFRRQGGTLSNGYTVLTFDDETEFLGIDDVGRHRYKGNAPKVTEVKAMSIIRN